MTSNVRRHAGRLGRGRRRAIVLGGLAAAIAVSGVSLVGQTTPSPLTPAARDEFQQKVLPVLQTRCVDCHNDIEYAGHFSVEAFGSPDGLPTSRDFWLKVFDKVSSGEMPASPAPKLEPADRQTITGWVARTFAIDTNADAATTDPGRVTARRLNRTEYDNTIRDLLGVTLKPADEFPVDDSGYGFDNIGDVLTVSPMLMEKYLRAARAVSKAAVFGESYPATPMRLVTLVAKKGQDDLPASGNELPFSIRGALYGTYRFPVEGEYEFRWRYVNFRGDETGPTVDAPAGQAAGGGRGRGGRGGGGRGAGPGAAPGADPNGGATGGAVGAGAAPGGPGGARGGGAGPGRGRQTLTVEEYRARALAQRDLAPPEPMIFTIDGTKVYEYTIEGTQNFDYGHGDNVARAHVAAGDHALRISLPLLANLDDPTVEYNNDGRRKLFVEHVDIVGPFNPVKAPPPGRAKIFICGAPGKYSAACTRQIVQNLATRAYRRPATPQEVERLVALVSEVRKHDSFDEAIRTAVEAILVSPSFLFRIERDPGPPALAPVRSTVPAAAVSHAAAAAPVPEAAYRISDYELASRLSYFLWSTMPDDALFQAARENRLHEPAVLDAQVARMLADPKADSLVTNFGEQWLNLRVMDRVKPDAGKFRQVDDELLDAMRTETRMFLSSVFHEDRSILDLIDGKFTFVNGPLARYYGIPGVDGEAFRRVTLDGEQRSGILTQAAILSLSSYATRTSPVLRGRWVLETMLGAPPPPPPPNVPALVTSGLGTDASMRQRLEQHRADPACGACHNRMDPIGFALENYDAAGRWRTKDGNFDIDSSGTLPDGRAIAGSKGLKDALRAQSDAFVEHFTDRLMTYALGRGLERSDRPVLAEIVSEVGRHDDRFTAVVSAIVHSRPFQLRSRVTP